MRFLNNILLLSILSIFSIVSVEAQIFPITEGYVVEVENSDNCFPVIVTEDRQIFEVVQSDVKLTPGDNITFAKTTTQTTSSCLLNNQVVIYVINKNSSGHSIYLCDYVDCVTPGDANLDGQVSMDDMIMVHQRSGSEGMHRPNASTEFKEQYSADWETETFFGNDLKHLDADGSGYIMDSDLEVISQNYNLHNEIEEVEYPVLAGFYVDIEFIEDEVVITDALAGQNAHTSAAINFTSSGQVLSNVSAISFQFSHSEEDFLKTEDIVFVQENPEFFEDDEEVPNKIFRQLSASENALDIGVSSLVPIGKTGIGRLGIMDFIIISDIIEGRSELEIPINIHIGDVKVHFNDGSIYTVNTNNDWDEVKIINQTFTDVEEVVASDNLGLSPNPVLDELKIEFPADFDRSGSSQLSIINTAGALMHSESLDPNQDAVLTLNDLSPGVYMLEIRSATTQLNKSFVKL